MSKADEVAETLTDLRVGDLVWWMPEPYVPCVVVAIDRGDYVARVRTLEGVEYYVDKEYLKPRDS